MKLTGRLAGIACLGWLLSAATLHAQVQTGSITGTVTDTSGGVLPGVTVSVSSDKLIGGVQALVSDETGGFRFDRLPPGAYSVRFELQGFKTVQRDDIRISASFVATLNIKLDVGQVTETITVKGESPTIDTKSNVQQTVMSQDILERVPSGRDPWSLAKIIPGVQVSTYDVGGTQSFQASSLSAHGSSTNDVTYNIDGASINWPGSGGGTTMLYYDQGMFEEVNYQTSAISAEVMAGGVSINMVTKEAGNQWRGNTRYSYANDRLQSDNWSSDPALQKFKFIGNPTRRLYDFNIGGGGALVRDRLWFTGSTRAWGADKLTNSKNLDGSRAIDDNNLKNYSAKIVLAITPTQKIALAYNWNNKIRGHRRDTPLSVPPVSWPAFVPDIASNVQRNPASTTQAKYTGIRKKTVFESSFSLMSGETDYEYQPGTPATAIMTIDTVLSTAANATVRREELPNSRLQFDNSVSYAVTAWGGEHLLKGGAQFARLRMLDQFWVQGDMWLVYNGGRPTSIYIFNTPTSHLSIEKIFGVYAQDAWTIGNRLTLNLGVRFDNNRGTIPDQASPAGTWIGARSISESQPINQKLGVWRTGVSYDPLGGGQTAIKASFSRYALQVGLDRVQIVHPFQFTSASCPWSDQNSNGRAEPNEIGKCSGFPGLSVRYAGANGPRWPHSDEVTAGVEQQIGKDVRIGVMYYHRTNRDQIGTRNLAVPTSAYTPVPVTVPSGTGPGGTATFYNLSAAYFGLQNNVIDNDPYLDTSYSGVELTANKRLSNRWQMMAGLTIGRNTGGVNAAAGQSTTADLNDPNNTQYPHGIIGNDSKVAFRLAGSYRMPGELMVSGSLISNGGYPFVSSYTVNRSIYPALTRSSQSVMLSERGAERLPSVSMIDLRVSRTFRFAGRQFSPQLDLYNITNASTITAYNGAVGSAYLAPTQILAPRIVRLGFSVDF